MINWNWDEKTKSVGDFTLGSPITEFFSSLIKLEKYDYEDYDTYQIEDEKYSKLFVKHGSIASIQCALHFIVNGTDIIGKTIGEAQDILEAQFHIDQDHPEWPQYMNSDETIEIIVDRRDTNHRIAYVIIRPSFSEI